MKLGETKEISREFSKELGMKLRHFRNSKGMSQEQLAFESSLNINSIGMIERGQKCPTVFTLKRICDSLGISLAALFLYDNSSGSNETAIQHVNEIMAHLSPEDAQRISVIVAQAAKIGQ